MAVAEGRLDRIEGGDLHGLGRADIDDVLDYVHVPTGRLPTYLSLYDRYLRQRWNVNELDEARHTVFFDRFYRDVVGLEGDGIMEILDGSWPYIQETFVGPFGLLAYLTDDLRRDPMTSTCR